jgi:phospholipid transport system substrate-binding protein
VRLSRVILAAGLVGLLVCQPARAADDPAVETVRTLYATYETALKTSGNDVKARAAAIGEVMAKTFDFGSMVRGAVGPKWSTFTPEQQGALTDAFGQYFTATYANRLAQAAGGKFVVKPASEARGGDRVVLTEVANAEGDESQVDFLVGAGTRVQDVFLNGNVSEIAAMRTTFSEPLKTGGADGLLKFLRERTARILSAKPAP